MADCRNEGFSLSFAFRLGKTARQEQKMQRKYSVTTWKAISGLLIGRACSFLFDRKRGKSGQLSSAWGRCERGGATHTFLTVIKLLIDRFSSWPKN
jgi:hypothetical protein